MFKYHCVFYDSKPEDPTKPTQGHFSDYSQALAWANGILEQATIGGFVQIDASRMS